MAYNAFTNSQIEVGKAIKKELWQKVKDNFDDHEDRLTQAISGSSKVEVFNLDVRLGSVVGGTLSGVLYHEAVQNFNLVEATIAIYENTVLTGVLSIDLKKGINPDNLNLTTVFTSQPTLNLATAVNYDKNSGAFNPSMQSVLKGEIIRLDITNIPNGLNSFRLIVIGEV